MAEIKCPCGLRNHMEEEDCKKTNCNACCPLTKPKTNADRIRAMTDEELHELLRKAYDAGCDDAVAYEWGGRKYSFEWTEEWLQQPAEGE